MRVRAVRMGYYQHHRRKPGDVFEMKEIMKEGDGLAMIDEKKSKPGALVPKKDGRGRIVRPSWVEDAAKPSKVVQNTGPRRPATAKDVIGGKTEGSPETSGGAEQAASEAAPDQPPGSGDSVI